MTPPERGKHERLALPAPTKAGGTSIEQALEKRRSRRDYSARPLALAELAQLLWAAQGVTDAAGLRTAPSAGALHPLQVYVLAGRVTGLAPGTYRYLPQPHALERLGTEDARGALAAAALAQSFLADAAAVLVLAARYKRTTDKYGKRGMRYVDMEAGHAAQNIYLEAVSLGLGTVTVGAFDDERVKAVVPFAPNEEPLCVMPLGR